MSQKVPQTPHEIRARLRRNGQTITQWAQCHGYTREAVYRVLNGRDKARFGTAHAIAVALGLVVPDEKPSTAAISGNTNPAEAA